MTKFRARFALVVFAGVYALSAPAASADVFKTTRLTDVLISDLPAPPETPKAPQSGYANPTPNGPSKSPSVGYDHAWGSHQLVLGGGVRSSKPRAVKAPR
jgi:hypothetical protein